MAFDATMTTISQAEAFEYLVNLRDSGITNMWGAAPYIEDNLYVSKAEAKHWLITWIKSFDGK